MKNKKTTTYLLLALCVLVWGIAGWKVYKAFDTTLPSVPTTKKEAKVVLQDSISLLLNYRDPFLGKYNVAASPEPSPIKKAVTNTPIIPKPQMKQEPIAPNIQFKGIMNIGKTSLAILQQDGRSFTIKVGEEIDGFKLVKMDDNRIVLRKERKSYEIPIR